MQEGRAFGTKAGGWMARIPALKYGIRTVSRLHHSLTFLFTLLLIILSSCSMINEDLDPCAPPPGNYTVVDFVYDYNMLDEDLFFDHVGSVYLYIFDEKGVYYDRRELHKNDLLPGEDFSMTFSEKELVPGNTYDFVAVAQGNIIGNDQSDEYQWFKLVNPMEPGVSTIEDYILKLDRDTNDDGFSEVGVVNYKDQYGQNQQMIDTLWTTKPDEVQTVTIKKVDYVPTVQQQPDIVTHVTVPMMRITNAIKVNLLHPQFSLATNPGDYHVLIHFPNGNGTIDFTGNTLPAQELYYQSLVKSMQPYVPKEYRTRSDNVRTSPAISAAKAGTRDDEEDSDSDVTDNDTNTYALQSLFGVSRLQVGDESSLQLRDATQEGYPLIYEIPNFSDVLADLLNESDWDNQEFLDREYDFQIDIALDSNDEVIWIAVSITVMDWAVRINFISW